MRGAFFNEKNLLRGIIMCCSIWRATPKSRFYSTINHPKIKDPSSALVNVQIEELKSCLVKILQQQQHSHNSSLTIAETIIYAELRNNNQGVVKVLAGALKPNPIATEITTVFETPVSCKIDGGQQIGMVVVKHCMEVAIRKAKISGICVVGCSNYSSATGALGIWAREISRNGLISVVMSQCPEMVAPCGSFEPIFGTNPIAIGIPTVPRVQVLDMATSASAWYGLVTAAEEGQTIPNDVAYDSEGRTTTDPMEAMRGALRVFDRGHKGSHLALMVELLAGAWTGAAMTDKHNQNNWGSLIIAIDPTILGPSETFQDRAMEMCNRVKSAKKLPGSENGEIFLPGERGDIAEEKNLKNGYIKMPEKLYTDLVAMASNCDTELDP